VALGERGGFELAFAAQPVEIVLDPHPIDDLAVPDPAGDSVTSEKLRQGLDRIVKGRTRRESAEISKGADRGSKMAGRTVSRDGLRLRCLARPVDPPSIGR